MKHRLAIMVMTIILLFCVFILTSPSDDKAPVLKDKPKPSKSVIIQVYRVKDGDGEMVVEYENGHTEIIYPDGRREPLVIVRDEDKAKQILKQINDSHRKDR